VYEDDGESKKKRKNWNNNATKTKQLLRKQTTLLRIAV